jgi:hypothetical protein
VGDRGWAGVLLSWRWAGPVLTAEISAVRYFIRCGRHEALAWGELRDVGGRRRVEVGSFPSVSVARAAFELDAQLRCRREGEQRDNCPDARGPMDVRTSPNRRGRGDFEAGSKSKPAE